MYTYLGSSYNIVLKLGIVRAILTDREKRVNIATQKITTHLSFSIVHVNILRIVLKAFLISLSPMLVRYKVLHLIHPLTRFVLQSSREVGI